MTNNFLQETALPIPYAKPILKWPAQLISYVFHPIFVPIYAIYFMVFLHPSFFTGFSDQKKMFTVIIAATSMVAYPLITILLLKAVGFIDSIFLHTRKDRIVPYMACGIFFFWAYTVFKKQPIYPPIISTFILGVFLAASAALIANIYFKVSMHALGMGGWLGLFWVIAKTNTMLMTWPLAILLLLTGLVCTARFVVSNHSQKDVYIGLIIGIICQFVASFVE